MHVSACLQWHLRKNLRKDIDKEIEIIKAELLNSGKPLK